MGGRKNKPAEMIGASAACVSAAQTVPPAVLTPIPTLGLPLFSAKEIDALLRSKATSADSVDAKLDSLLTLVRYTRDKDVFRAFYVAALAKRLLLNRSSSEDAELKMVTRLKHELGEDFMKGDGMMADLKLSEGLMKGYRARVSPAQDMDLSVNVLSAANWPSCVPDYPGPGSLEIRRLTAHLARSPLLAGTRRSTRAGTRLRCRRRYRRPSTASRRSTSGRTRAACSTGASSCSR